MPTGARNGFPKLTKTLLNSARILTDQLRGEPMPRRQLGAVFGLVVASLRRLQGRILRIDCRESP
jgi:hypothetical protein